MNPDGMPKTRSVWPTVRVKIARRQKWTWIGIPKPDDRFTAHGMQLQYVIRSLY